MKRRWIKLLAIATAAMGVLDTALWLRSYFAWDLLRMSGHQRVELNLARGVATVVVQSKFSGETGDYNYRMVVPGDRLWLGDQSGWRVELLHGPIADDPHLRLGLSAFSLSHSDRIRGEGLFQSVRVVRSDVSVPLWVFATVPLAVCFAAVRTLRQTTPREGMCPDCRYDLRATPERCPECGTFGKRKRGRP